MASPLRQISIHLQIRTDPKTEQNKNIRGHALIHISITFY